MSLIRFASPGGSGQAKRFGTEKSIEIVLGVFSYLFVGVYLTARLEESAAEAPSNGGDARQPDVMHREKSKKK